MALSAFPRDIHMELTIAVDHCSIRGWLRRQLPRLDLFMSLVEVVILPLNLIGLEATQCCIQARNTIGSLTGFVAVWRDRGGYYFPYCSSVLVWFEETVVELRPK